MGLPELAQESWRGEILCFYRITGVACLVHWTSPVPQPPRSCFLCCHCSRWQEASVPRGHLWERAHIRHDEQWGKPGRAKVWPLSHVLSWSKRSFSSLFTAPLVARRTYWSISFSPQPGAEAVSSAFYSHSWATAVADGLPLLFSMANLVILLPKCLFHFSLSLFFLGTQLFANCRCLFAIPFFLLLWFLFI